VLYEGQEEQKDPNVQNQNNDESPYIVELSYSKRQTGSPWGCVLINYDSEPYGLTAIGVGLTAPMTVQVYSRPAEKVLAWVKNLLGDPALPASIQDIKNIYKGIDSLVYQKDFQKLNFLISSLIKLPLSYELKTAALRYTAPIKEKIPSWRKSVTEAQQDLETLGLDAGQILRGLT